MDKSNQTYDFVCFSDLSYEFDPSESAHIEKKIKRRLKYYKLEPYKQERIDYIRQLKNELHNEISKCNKSIYYKGHHGKFANPNDFDFELLKDHFSKKYSLIDEKDMEQIVSFAIYLYYLR